MHIAVLMREVADIISPEKGDIIFDATLGGGGHTGGMIEKVLPGGKVLAADKDREAIRRVREKFAHYGDSIEYFNDDFRHVDRILRKAGVRKIDGAVFDLGFSSFQIDEAARGFSFQKEGPLDMRFDTRGPLSACDVVNRFSRDELGEIIRDLGEERHSRRIAAWICEARKEGKISTTLELSRIIERAVGRFYLRQRLHPACRTFQALRIFVNDELGALEEGLDKAIEALDTGARVCVLSFHSLEDRIVKNIFKQACKVKKTRMLTKKPILPGMGEKKANPRARSAKLRAVERI